MSWYYNYYLGYRKDGKIYPLGPYDRAGELHNVFSRSRSSASDLHDEFYSLNKEEASDELKEAFPYEFTEDAYGVGMMILDASDLPKGSYIKRGYFLIDDVKAYLSDEGADFDGFYDKLEPEVFAAKLLNEAKLGPPKPRKNDYGETYTPHAAADYMYFAYPDYESKEYEVALLKNAISSFEYADVLKDAEIVILLTQG